jgi:hypothetical protein
MKTLRFRKFGPPAVMAIDFGNVAFADATV